MNSVHPIQQNRESNQQQEQTLNESAILLNQDSSESTPNQEEANEPYSDPEKPEFLSFMLLKYFVL